MAAGICIRACVCEHLCVRVCVYNKRRVTKDRKRVCVCVCVCVFEDEFLGQVSVCLREHIMQESKVNVLLLGFNVSLLELSWHFILERRSSSPNLHILSRRDPVSAWACLCAALTCVAQITGLPAELQRPIIIFWAMKTFSAGISIPRSPLATITPSLSARISSKLTDRLREMRWWGIEGKEKRKGSWQRRSWQGWGSRGRGG